MLQQELLGNIYLKEETVKIPVSSEGDTIEWDIVDFWGEQIASGETPVRAGAAIIEPHLNRLGYFELNLVAKRSAAIVEQQKTAFAVIRPTEVDSVDTRYGVVTHFAKGWDTDLISLISKAGIKAIRDEQIWRKIEVEKGIYNFPDSYDFYMNELEKHGIDPLIVMAFGNPGYDWEDQKPVWAVRRWISSVEGTLQCTGQFQLKSDLGDGQNFKILIDGKVVCSWPAIDTDPHSLNETILVSEGSVVDFAIASVPGWNAREQLAEFIIRLSLEDQVIADSVNDFSGSQGEKNWFYGFYTGAAEGKEPNPKGNFSELIFNPDTSEWISSNPLFKSLSLNRTGGRPALVGNFPGFSAPYTDQGRVGYANYGKEILEHYGARVKTLEVWNEYNGSFVTGPADKNRPYYYTEMIKKVYQELKRSYPDRTILGAACVLIPAGYLENIFELGGLQSMDAVVIHPYEQWGLHWPEGVEQDIEALNERMKHYHNGNCKPIWVTEYGNWTPDRHFVAKFIARQTALMSSIPNVERMYVYLMRDYEEFNGMGLLRSENAPEGRYAPNPSYVVYANLIHQLYRAIPAGREKISPYSSCYVLKFVKPEGETIRVCWSGSAEEVVIFQTSHPLTVVDLMGEEQWLQPHEGQIKIRLGDAAVFVRGEVEGVLPVAIQPIADSQLSFSNSQGQENWYYGYYEGAESSYSLVLFEPMQYTYTDWNWQWQAGDDKFLMLTRTGGFSSQTSREKWAIRRWISQYEGTIRIKGILGLKNNKKQDTEHKIFVDGREVFHDSVKPEELCKNYETTVTVKSGSIIDFIIKNGSGHPNTNQGKTVFTATIYPADPYSSRGGGSA